MLLATGVTLVIPYNRVPTFDFRWSNTKSFRFQGTK